MSITYEKIPIKRDIDLPGFGPIEGKSTAVVPQVGFSTDENGNEVFDGLDLEEMLNVIEINPVKDSKTDPPVMKTPAEIQTEREREVVRHFNNGLKSALRSSAYASAGSLSEVGDTEEERKQVRDLKKTLDSFCKNFGMTPEQAAVAVRSIPAVQAVVTRLQESGVLKTKPA